MIKRELKEVSAMRRKVSDLRQQVEAAKKNGNLEHARILQGEVNALNRSVQDYEDRTDPQGKNRKGS